MFSLFLHWKRSEEHPDVADLRQQVLGLSNEVVDLHDRLGAWMKRDSVRKARQGKQEKAQDDEEHHHQGPVSKDELRRQVAQVMNIRR